MSAASGQAIEREDPGEMPAACDGCQTCAELTRQHADASKRFDYSAAVDVRIWMRGHQSWHHPDHRIAVS
ncbi:hypothetical protein [Kitasatospora sp. NPDC005751]|uniref:hypothetical protein n=1 Tax=Kitasatospora sp. NPDC005751 TaxID=3157064 RepID=UPI0034003041